MRDVDLNSDSAIFRTKFPFIFCNTAGERIHLCLAPDIAIETSILKLTSPKS